MKIAEIEAIPVRIPLKKPFRIALGTLTHSNHVLVRMRDEGNRFGWGETTTFLEVYGYDQRSLYQVLCDYLIPAVRGLDPENLVALHGAMDAAVPFNLMAKCAMDLAAHDLRGRTQETPLHGLLGGRRTDRVPLAMALGIDDPRTMGAMAKDLVAEGCSAIKIKIGLDPEGDLARIRAVREAIGDRARLRADANQGYDRASALRVARMAEPFALEWLEQPLRYWDLEGLATLRRACRTPIAVDESVYTPQDAQAVVRAGAADVVNIKLPRCGGLFRARAVAAVCEAADIPCFVGGCLETTPGTAAQAHFYTATPNVVSAAEMEGPWCYTDDVVTQRLVLQGGTILVPTGPGLGVTIDEERVARYRVDL